MIVIFNIPVWIVLLGLFTFSFMVAYVSAVIDARIIRLKFGKIVSLNHLSRNIIRGTIFTGSTLIMCQSVESFCMLLLYQSVVFSFYFDIILNMKRGLSIWYIGKTAGLDVFVRHYFKGDGGMVYATLKIILIFILICTYVKFIGNS